MGGSNNVGRREGYEITFDQKKNDTHKHEKEVGTKRGAIVWLP